DEVHEHEVMFDAAVGVPADAIEHLHDRSDLYRQAGFLEHFARDRLFQRLAHLDAAAGQTPVSLERRMTSLDQQDSRAVEHDGTDADDRAFGIRPHDDSPRTRRAVTLSPRRLTLTSTECSSRPFATGQYPSR